VSAQAGPNYWRTHPNNELVIYPDAGHGGIFQFHEQFVEKALEFLAK
jgi:pimeloyl-ACP methyl ester carboxylesterase